MIIVPSDPYRWSLSHTMITAPSGPYRPLFHTVSTKPSSPYSFFLSTSKVYASMKHKTNDLNMTYEMYMNVDKK